MARKNRLKLRHDGLVINATIYSEKMTPEAVDSRPEIVVRDEEGRRVEREQYDKATDEPLAEGYGHRWVTEDGEVVDSEALRRYQVLGGEEEEIDRHEPTLGRERTLQALDWIPIAELGEFLVERTYEVWAEDDPDVAQLYELAEHVRGTGMAPVVPVVLRRSVFRSWGIVTPYFYEDSFSLVMRVTDSRVSPEHEMPVRPDATGEEPEETRSAQQEWPFG